jgi:hypothetical protein
MNFKKHILLLVLLFAVFVTNAQHKPFQFGFQGGLNAGWFATKDAEYTNSGGDVGGLWGFVTDIYIMEGYSFTSGFNVLYLNGAITLTDTKGTLTRNVHTRYLQVPLIFTLKTKRIGEKVRIYGQIGYGLGFLLRARANDTFLGDEGETTDENINIYDELSFTRSSLIVGIGIELPIYGSTIIRTGIKFDNAFLPVFKSEDAKVRNNFFDINLAILF